MPQPSTRPASIRFEAGTVVVDGVEEPVRAELIALGAVVDERVGALRARADRYRELFACLHRAARESGGEVDDAARAYGALSLRFRNQREPRDYQKEAIAAWVEAGRRGQVVLPTGAGKTFVAQLAIHAVQRSALVVVPTLDLMHQWYDGLLGALDVDEIGLLGGGYHDVRDVTVSTYDSFAIHAPRLGNRFGLLVFDECHHLPAPGYLAATEACLAPFRLGLTATPERDDGRDALLDEKVGPIVYRRGIRDMAGGFLADYDVERIAVTLNDEELERYTVARETYSSFVRSRGIRMSSRDGWARFIQLSAQSPAGRDAMRAYREQRRVALMCRAKLDLVEHLVAQHADERVLVFTNDNPSVYELSRRLLIPAITHQTPVKERREILQRFRDGTYRVVVTAKVLNEGVDVPEASVAIVLSGSGSVREHVQRLGRVLRPAKGKRAQLYEVITQATVEEFVSERRREHDAYR